MPRAFSSFYAGSGMRANAFLPRGFGSADDRRIQTALAARRRVPATILDVLRSQNAELPASPARESHLQTLSEAGSVVVATGQQVGLFGGPLYSVYKAATAIVIARALTREMGVRAVPLFWLQTEDQDFAEVATTVVPVDNAPPLRLSLLEAPEAVRCSLADRVLGDDVAVLTDALADAMAALPASGEVLDLLRLHYRPGVSPGRAFAGVVGTLFAEDGLLLFDPRCRPVSEHATPLLRRALTDAPALELALESRVAALREAGFSEQIELRPGSPLVFFHLRDARGPRYRLTRCEGGYAIHGGDGALTDAELLRTLDHDPLRFSTSALLRPILQDTLFPTAVYVGGAAEVSYFAQLQPLYEAFDLEPPLIAERAHFRLVPPRVRSLLDKLALTPADLDLPRSELLEKAAVTGDADLRPGTQWGAELEQRLDRLAASHKDQALERAVERARSSILHALALLGERYQRITLERDQVRSSRLTRVEGWLRPEGSLQERVFGFPAFASFVGLDRFRRLLIDAVDPMNPGFREIDL